MPAAPKAAPHRKTTARIARTLGFDQPDSSVLNMWRRLWTNTRRASLVRLGIVADEVHQYRVPPVRWVALHRRVAVVLSHSRAARVQVAIPALHADHIRAEQQRQRQRCQRQPLAEWGIQEDRPDGVLRALFNAL